MNKNYQKVLNEYQARYPNGSTPGGISVEDLVQLSLQNTYKTHLEIAQDMSKVMRKDMADYDQDNSKFTQSLGCWSGFHAMQMIKAVKQYRGTADKTYVYLSGWMVAGLRNRFGHLPDQSMHEKTSVVDLIQEIYQSLKQADEVAMNDLFKELKNSSNDLERQKTLNKINNFESHIVPIIADIDAGFGNIHATYLLAKQMIQAGACCIQIENQVSDAKQCGHQDGKVTVPREDFLEKLKAVRMAFEELGVSDGVIVARTDSLGAGLTQKIPVSETKGDMAYEYIKWLKMEDCQVEDLKAGDHAIQFDGKLKKLSRLSNGLYQFQENTGVERVVEDGICNLVQGEADMLWIETATPNVGKIAEMVNRIREQAPHAKLTYNNSPSFNWTLNIRKQVREDWIEQGKIKENEYPNDLQIMGEEYDQTDLGVEADNRLQSFQNELATKAGVFHNLITLPTFHLTAKGVNELSRDYFGEQKMLSYVKNVQRQEIRQEVSAVKHQHEVGSNVGDSFKEMVSGDRALKAGGKKNTMNQFSATKKKAV